MRTADAWDPPEESTIGGVANRIIRELTQSHNPPNLFHYDSESARKGRENAGRTATARAAARKSRR